MQSCCDGVPLFVLNRAWSQHSIVSFLDGSNLVAESSVPLKREGSKKGGGHRHSTLWTGPIGQSELYNLGNDTFLLMFVAMRHKAN